MLLPGRWVEIRPVDEIVGTLDERQSLDGLVFMPEMLPFCQRRFQVVQRAERTCTYLAGQPLRKLTAAVALAGVRCDGASHGGCQLGCVIYWKEAWLRVVDGPSPSAPTAEPPDSRSRADAELHATVDGAPGIYFCQATMLPEATTPGDPLWSPGQYLRFLRARTFGPVELARMFTTPLVRRLNRIVRLRRRPHAAAEAAPRETLALEPGDWVEVRSLDEILATLDERRTHRGLSFGGEMYGMCGRQMRVQGRCERILDEKTGRIRQVRDTVLLEGAACEKYLGCARGMPFMWREAWLKRVEPHAS